MPKETDAQMVARLRAEIQHTLQPIMDELLGAHRQPAAVEQLTGIPYKIAWKTLHASAPRAKETEVILKLLLSIIAGIRDRADEMEEGVLRCLEILMDHRVLQWRKYSAARRPLLTPPDQKRAEAAKRRQKLFNGYKKDHRGVKPLRRNDMEMIEDADSFDGFEGGRDPEVEALLKQAGIQD